MIKFRKKLIQGMAAAAVGVSLMAGLSVTSYAEKPPYLKSATYTGDDWVINFWNTELDHLEEDMEQIASDGFNSIVLVIPWREFQPMMDPVSYNEYAFHMLDEIMESAERHGLWVQLRVSYTWDYYEKEEAKMRFRRLLKEPEVMEAWKLYVNKVYEAASAHGNFYGGFITWEDFWNYVEDSVGFGSGSVSVKEADAIGYQSWLSSHYTLEQLNELYRPDRLFRSYDMVYLPQGDSPARKAFYEFYDDKLNHILAEGQSVFPNLSMEVRLDVDPVEDGDGEKIGAHHYRTFPCQGADYTSVMYSVSMGQDFGMKITAEEALRTMTAKMAEMRTRNKNKPIYIDQLLYMDATEKFSHNTRLIEEERPRFLEGLPDILKTYTNGYAVWTYRNYANNPVFNSEFGMGTRGWSTDRVRTEEHSGSKMAHFEAGGRLTQDLEDRMESNRNQDIHVRFTAESDQQPPVNLTVSSGSVRKTVTVSGKKSFDLNFGKTDFNQIIFMSDGYVYLDDVSVYNFVQDGQLYDSDGEELSCIGAVRNLNGRL